MVRLIFEQAIVSAGFVLGGQKSKGGRYVQICEKLPLSGGLFYKFVENYATMPPLRGIGFKDRGFGGIFLGKEVPRPVF